MQKLSKFYFTVSIFFFFVICSLSFVISLAKADVEAFPKLRYPCADEGLDPEFHSLRPYQAAACGDPEKALFCSNEIKFIESFNFDRECKRDGATEDYWCKLGDKGYIKPHNLLIELTESEFAIMGNTEQVTNSQGGTEVFDDATKVNEYASWYLSGVNNRAEYGENTDDKVVNYSGPMQKLIPKMIQEAERVRIIKTATNKLTYFDEDLGIEVTEAENHDQIVVCEKGNNAVSCPDGKALRLSDWEGDLSFLRSQIQNVENIANSVSAVNFGAYIGQLINNGSLPQTPISSVNIPSGWNKRTPPLPWDDGTDTTGKNPKPFASQVLYQKAYNEWQGKTCAILPILGLQCIDNPLVKNKWAELYQYIPLSNTSDQGGANYIIGDGPDIQASSSTTKLVPKSGMIKDFRNAPLYFAHVKEVKESTELLNKTYTPGVTGGFKGGKSTVSGSGTFGSNVEKNECSAANIRVNEGDNLFPGDPAEMQVIGVEYQIDEVLCKVTMKKDPHLVTKTNPDECGPLHYGETGYDCSVNIPTVVCNAEVNLILHTGTKTPWADEIFSTTVAGPASTFRKIFPKVEEGAPVSCIADIPTVTNVTYDTSGSQKPKDGDQEVKTKKYPEDGAGTSTELTFPHVGSVYEYFLKGIQTALRPKGYGEPIANGNCVPSLACGELPENLPKATGVCNLGGVSSRIGDIPQSLKDIVSAAAETFKVPPNLILAALFGEGRFNSTSTGGGTDGTGSGLPWSDFNVKNWATCSKIPNCNETGEDNFIGFNGNVFQTIASKEEYKKAMKAIDPTRTKYSQCNLLDSIFAAAWNLHDNADGGGGLPKQCYGINLTAPVPTSCSWTNEQYESAIKVSESGYTDACLTLPGSCATGGGLAAACPNGDTCERNGGSGNTSHNACVFDVAHGK